MKEDAGPLHTSDFAQLTLRGTAWTYSSRFAGKSISFLSMLLLTRLLTKEDFGVAAFALCVIQFLVPISDLGLRAAMIYHKEDQDRTSTGFWLGLGIGIVLCCITWASAPLVAQFFGDPRAAGVTRLLSIHFPIRSLLNVHESLLQKRLAFRSQFTPSFLRAVGKAFCSIALALYGFGAWSLVIGALAGDLVAVFAYWIVLPWRPSLRVSLAHARMLLRYGSDLVVVNVLTAVMLNADYFLIGHVLGAGLLGLYMVGFRIPDLLIGDFCHVLSKVLFPVYVKIDNNARALNEAFLLTLRHIAILILPMGIAIAFLARPFMLTFFTREWWEATPVIQAIAVYATMLSLSRQAGNIAKARGQTSILIKLNALRIILLLPALYWAVKVPASIAAVAWVQAAAAAFTCVGNLYLSARLLEMSMKVIVNALKPASVCTFLTASAILLSNSLTASAVPSIQLAAGSAMALTAYGVTCWSFHRHLLVNLKDPPVPAVARQ